MIAAIRNWFRERALTKAQEACDEILYAALMARINDDHAAARYFEAELVLAKNRVAALLGDPNPGRYCCDQRCEKQGWHNCACESLPPVPRKAIP